MGSMKAALYVRTSTVDQTVDNQVRELEAVAERLGHEIMEVYADSGGVSRRQLARQFGVGRETIRRLLCGGD